MIDNKELIRRYNYINSNIEFVTDEKNKRTFPSNLLSMMESFLKKDVPLEKTEFYSYIETRKNDKRLLQDLNNQTKKR